MESGLANDVRFWPKADMFLALTLLGHSRRRKSDIVTAQPLPFPLLLRSIGQARHLGSVPGPGEEAMVTSFLVNGNRVTTPTASPNPPRGAAKRSVLFFLWSRRTRPSFAYYQDLRFDIPSGNLQYRVRSNRVFTREARLDSPFLSRQHRDVIIFPEYR